MGHDGLDTLNRFDSTLVVFRRRGNCDPRPARPDLEWTMKRKALWGSATAAGLFLSALVGVLLGLGTFTFRAAKGTAYLSNNPTACVNCHIMRDQYDSWQKSSHH